MDRLPPGPILVSRCAGTSNSRRMQGSGCPSIGDFVAGPEASIAGVGGFKVGIGVVREPDSEVQFHR